MTTAIKALAPYQPEPWQLRALRDKSFVCLMTGSAGGGKSRTAAEKLHGYGLKYPGATILALRKAREYATKSIVPMLKNTVIGNDPRVRYMKSELTFRYQNGSAIFIGGMKNDEQREAIRSIGQNGAVDMVWMEEATAFTERDFNEVLARMRGTAAPWMQIIPTTNPDAPTHWIHQRLILGKEASVHYSSARDNSHNPAAYHDNLERLTGLDYSRLVEGKWIQAQGVIYDNFSILEVGNVTDDAEYNPDLPVWWGVDDGYSAGQGPGTESYHPRVFLAGQQTSTGGINIFYEYYVTHEVSGASIQHMLSLPYKKAQIACIDSSAADLRGQLWQAGIQTIPATHKVAEGIKTLRSFICDGNDMRRVHIHPRCTELIRELQSYRYRDTGDTSKPRKADDHGCDALRYMIYTMSRR